MSLILKLDMVVGLIRAGIATAAAIHQSVADGKARVQDAQGRDISVEELNASIDEALVKAAETGDAAAGRIDDRHEGDGTGVR